MKQARGDRKRARRQGGRHRLGTPPPLLEWIMVCEPGTGGRHRLHYGPPGGVIAAAGVVLLATAASPATTPSPAPAGPPPPGGKAAAAVPDEAQAWAAAGDHVPADAATPAPAALAGESTVDVEPRIPTVFTGDIPTTVLDAYRHARDLVNATQPGCHLPLELLAAIGKVETGHARRGQVDTHGTTLTPILGPVLNGNVFAAIADTDRGTLDGDGTWDRAVGPMQFIPGTWKSWAADGNGDGRADPHNVYDASLAAARYLCAANRDLGTPQGLDDAIFSYNHSTSYRNLVLAWMTTYRSNTTIVPDAPLFTIPATPPHASTVDSGPARSSSTTTQPTTSTTPPASTTPAPPTSSTPAPPTSSTPQPPVSSTPAPPTSSTPAPPTSSTPAPPTSTTTAAPSSTPTAPASTTSTPPPDPTPTGPVDSLLCATTGLLNPLLGTPNCHE